MLLLAVLAAEVPAVVLLAVLVPEAVLPAAVLPVAVLPAVAVRGLARFDVTAPRRQGCGAGQPTGQSRRN